MNYPANVSIATFIMTESDGVSEVRQRLLAHFSASSAGTTKEEPWSKLWDEGTFLPWDRGHPNPALEDLLNERRDMLGTPWTEAEGIRRRKRALVPGCGRGYDVLLLASFGYDAYGLDISKSAIEKCKTFAEEHAKDYPPRDNELGAGSFYFLQGDFFKDDWLEMVQGGTTFELLYDYTFLSALPPSLRPAWSLRYTQLLANGPSSCLICVEFPTNKPPATGGPPFALPPKVYLAHLTHPGEQLPYDDEDNLLEEKIEGKSPTGLERIAHWQPERTHEIGKGSDWVSVWKHVNAP